MNTFFKRTLSWLLTAAMLAAFILLPLPAMAAHYTGYSDLAIIYNKGSCPSMQGICSDDTYIYCSKISSDETACAISRTHRTTGETVWLTNSATGTNYFSNLYHANDLDIADIDGVKTLFVATGGAGSGDYSLVRFALSGTTATMVGNYNVKYNGTSTYLASAQVMSVEGDTINLICKRSKYIFTTSVGVNQTSGDLELKSLCTLDLTDVNFNGTSKDISTYVQQGFEYYDGKIYVPMCEPNDMIISCISCWDVVGASGTIKNNPIFSVWSTTSTYTDLFEFESCTICPSDNIMYINTNRRKTSSDANWDGLLKLSGFVYDASVGDSTLPGNYRWDVGADRLTSVTTDGAQFNHAQIIKGTVADGEVTSGHYSLDQAVILKHSQPWILEWQSSSLTSNSLLLSQQTKSGYTGNYYLYARKDGLVSLGTYDGSQYCNYGINITNHSLKAADSHVYRLENRIASDGSNMVYLSVDGTDLGAMNNYFVGGTAQNTTSDWVNGKDFVFNYLGTTQHPLAATYSYIRVWGEGLPGQVDEPNTFRWETQSNAMTSIQEFDLTTNEPTVLYGTCTDGTYADYQAELAKDVTLLHNRPWSVEWNATNWGGGMILAAASTSQTMDAPYLFHGSVISLGKWNGTKYDNYGIKLSDHGIDNADNHTYRLTNKINDDGTNMVYLSVDGTEIGPLNGYYLGTTSQNTTSDWVSGKDFTLSYMGTYQHDLAGELSYIHVWEDGIPQEQGASLYRWEPVSNALTSITTDGYKQNNATAIAGTISGTAFSDSWYRLDQSIVLLHDRSWSIQWESEGTWRGTTNGAMLLSASRNKNELNAPYLYRRGNSEIIAFGARGDGNHYNYGIRLADHGIDGTAKHTYLLTNKVNSDGTNMVYLSVDGVELGAMNNYFVGGTAQNTTDNWVSGKDFVFSYLGTPQFPIDSCDITYLMVDESCDHSYGDWVVTTAATCTTSGSRTHSCTLCGEVQTEEIPATGHSYQGVITAPTCTTGGYTTYTCATCGDTYQGDAVDAAGHSYQSVVTDATCTAQGYTTYTCTVCGDSYKGSYTDPVTHSYQGTVTASTCTTQGYTTYTCTGCGSSYQDLFTDPLGHSYQSVVTAPTCTTGGYTTHTCTICGDSYQDSQAVATGHSFTDGTCTICGAADPSYVDPNAEYYLFGYINGTNYACEEDAENMGIYKFVDGKLTAKFNQDSYVAVKTGGNKAWYMTEGWQGNAVTSVTLYNTATLFAADKLFVPGNVEVTFTLAINDDGSLTLSYEEVTASTAPTLSLSFPTLTFEDMISMNVYFTATDISDVVEMGMITYSSSVSDYSVETAEKVIPGYTWSDTYQMYVVTTGAIAAKNMSDEIFFSVYAKLADGTYIYSRLVSYSPTNYAYDQLNTGSESVKNLMVAMLNYGAEAQTFFNYRTDALMNANLTDAQKASIESYRADMMDSVASVSTSKAANFTRTSTGFTSRYPSISFEGAFQINYYCVPSAAVKDNITLYYWNQTDYDANDVLSVDNATGAIPMTQGTDRYEAAVTGIAAKDLDKGIYVAFVYSDGTNNYCSGILGYSIGAYCVANAATTDPIAPIAPFAQATAVYGYYAKQLFV